MSDAERTLLVFEPQPTLADFLGDQITGWRIRHCPPDTIPEDADAAHAAILAGAFDHTALAAKLRALHLVGPLFSLAEPGQEVTAPLIALSKPLRLNGLVSRLNEPGDSDVDMMPVGQWRLDIAQKSLVEAENGRLERLTDRELALLAMLIRLSPGTLSREELQSRLWGYNSETTTHTVETHIWRLRQKLEADPTAPVHLLTTAEGYCLCA